MRTLALADAWCSATDGNAVFAMCEAMDGVVGRIQDHGHKVNVLDDEPASQADRQALIETRHRLGEGPVVVDGYHFPSSYLRSVREQASPLVYLDDTVHLDDYPVDVFVNPSSSVHPSEIPSPGPDRCLLGPDHVLLRPEFHPYWDWERSHPENVGQLLVTLGGADPVGATPEVLGQLRGGCGDLEEVEVVTRAANTDVDEIRERLNHLEPTSYLSLDVDDMAQRMERADLAICAGGTTAWELAFMQVPMILTRLASNQREVSASLVQSGVAHDLGRWSQVGGSEVPSSVTELSSDRTRREEMGETGRELVDGRGADRVVDAMRRC